MVSETLVQHTLSTAYHPILQYLFLIYDFNFKSLFKQVDTACQQQC